MFGKKKTKIYGDEDYDIKIKVATSKTKKKKPKKLAHKTLTFSKK